MQRNANCEWNVPQAFPASTSLFKQQSGHMVRDGAPDSASALPGARLLTMGLNSYLISRPHPEEPAGGGRLEGCAATTSHSHSAGTTNVSHTDASPPLLRTHHLSA